MWSTGVFDPILPYLESLVCHQEELVHSSAYELAFQLDTEFHRIFYNLTNKEFVLEHTGEKDIHYLRARLLSLRLENPIAMPAQHRAIINAIKAHKEDDLHAALQEYLIHVNLIIGNGHPDLAQYITAEL